MGENPLSLRKYDLRTMQTWFGVLRHLNEKEKNRKLALDYFSRQFARDPQGFYYFLFYFEQAFKKDVHSQKALAEKYLQLLSPLAERFGLFEQKARLEDLCFRQVYSDRYADLDQKLKRYKSIYPRILQKITAMLTQILEREGYENFEIKARYKTLYSLYKKIEKKGEKKEFRPKDMFGFRIILKNNSVDECFEVVNRLHDSFEAVPAFFKDYINVPKINGYQSLHTGLLRVVPELNLPIEVQVRTQEMDDFAEKGLAAHWFYGDKKRSTPVAGQQRKVEGFLNAMGTENSTIHCFSEKGDLFSLERGSSLVDYAYQIHSELGHRSIGGFVNGKRQPLHYQVQDGDKIHIETGEKAQPRRDWLKYAKRRETKREIQDFLKRKDPSDLDFNG